MILNTEQLEAKRDAARAANPNRAKLDALWAQRLDLANQIHALTSDAERYYNLLYMLADTDEKAAMAKCMTDNELGAHLIGLCPTHNEMDQAIVDEVLTRLGYVYEEPSQ